MTTATALDHAAVVVPDLAEAEADWRRLGFALTPRALHADAAGVPTGTANATAMLRQGYVELLAVIDPAKPSGTIARFLSRGPGIHILSLATADSAAALARLRRAGFDTALARTARDGARFARLPLADSDPRLQLIHHETPELVWRAEHLAHPNRAIALDSVIVIDDPPARFAARLSRAAGLPLTPDPLGGYALDLPAGRIRVLHSAEPVFPGASCPDFRPWIAGLAIRTDDNCAAIAAMNVARRTGSGWLARASGVQVAFIG
jgi:hypothetical protein